MDNQAALALVQRFMHNKREFDGTPTRDRFKLIPRIVNVAEWAEKGPLSGAYRPCRPHACQEDGTNSPAIACRSLHLCVSKRRGAVRSHAVMAPSATGVCLSPRFHDAAGYEHRLLMNYNDKPLLTRPQQRFYTGEREDESPFTEPWKFLAKV